LTIVKAERRPDLDGVRGIAILMVLMVHSSFYAHNLPRFVEDVAFYGVRGVQLFFIASGLTLTLAHQGRALHFGNFAKRRFLRIAPMFYVGAALYLILNAAGGPFRYTSPPRISEVIETLAFIHGWFPNAVNKIVPGGWSIAAEAMFYVAFPALLILRHRPLAMLATLVGSYAVAGATHFALMRILPPVRKRKASPSVSGSANCRHLHWAAGSRSRSAIGSAVLGSRPGLRPWRRLC
jgi:exopolysaccharide production protein ExoZ